MCDSILTERELAMALKDMKNQKSSGSDGLKTEFYKLFWHDIKKLVHRFNKLFVSEWKTYRTSKSKCRISYSEIGERYIILENWRPISLLNVDYKIATKAITNRVKKVLPKIIHNSQTGFLKGRYIEENIRLLFEILENAEEQKIPGMIFFSDFEKAFDSIDHDYLIKCLRHFNFGDSFIN